MWKNMLKTAFRGLLRRKGHALINITGLATGMAACLLIFAWVQHETGFDRHHRNAGRTYRMASSLNFAGKQSRVATMPAPLAATLRAEFPEVEAAVRFRPFDAGFVRAGQRLFKEERFVYADPGLFEIFTIPLEKGQAASALREPGSLILSRRTADRLFPGTDPVGQTVTLENNAVCEVTGVYTDFPDASHFHFDAMLSMAGLEESRDTHWLTDNFYTYLLLRTGADPARVEARFPELIRSRFSPVTERLMGKSYTQMESEGQIRIRYWLQPLGSIHLDSDLRNEFEPNGSRQRVWVFSCIAVFILIIAAVNFINLTIALASVRTREAGIRKTAGAGRGSLIRQFLCESILLSLLALSLALLLAHSVLPAFNRMADREMSLSLAGNAGLWGTLAVMVLAAGLLAGLYPALLFSASNPVRILKGDYRLPGGRNGLRRLLVVFQFATASVLITGTVVVYRQLEYIHSKPLGFGRQQVLVVEDTQRLGERAEVFRQEVLKNPGFLSGSVAGVLPLPTNQTYNGVLFPDLRQHENATNIMAQWSVDPDYLDTLQIKLASGRNFSRERPADRQAVLINESAARVIGWKEPAGHLIGVPRPRQLPKIVLDSYTVIGVVKDFHFESLRDAIRPLVIFNRPVPERVVFRLDTARLPESLGWLDQVWRRLAPGQRLNYSFLDSQFAAAYRTDQNFGRLIGIFAALAVGVGCLGLLGLASFLTRQRTKEIGIRRVLGASTGQSLLLLGREYLVLVLVANLLAGPLAWWLMSRWLSNFTYRIEPGLLPFAAALLATGILTAATVIQAAWHTARLNPADSLRTE